MELNAKTLPDNYARLVSEKDRKRLGISTAAERLTANEVKNERALQVQIVNLLRLRGIEVLWHRTDKKSAATVGWPDLTFCVRQLGPSAGGQFKYEPIPVVWEIKLPQGKLSPEQEAMHKKLQTPPNAFRVRVIRSVDEAIEELRSMGIQ